MQSPAVPERFAMWSCIGCGAMGTDQPCLGPCEDRALGLVRAVHHDAGGPAAEVAGTEPFRAWLCVGCGRAEAPQPCLGVCLRQPDEVVRADRHAEALARAADADRDARALRALVRRLAWTRPREERFDETVSAMREAALALLGATA